MFPLHSQLHALSEDGCLTSCSVCDPPVLLYVKKQMEEGTLLDTVYMLYIMLYLIIHVQCMHTHITHVL